MFALTTLVYPCLLGCLCLGCGLLVDRLSGRVLPGALLAPVGGALLIALSQLMTYDAALAPLTPVAMVALAALGIALEAPRLRRELPLLRRGAPVLWLGVLVYLLALAPVLFSGRTTFSAYGTLTDSAFHMVGADYLIRYGQHYTGLDLTNSYGQYIANYYGTHYPSGADSLFGGSAFILGLPLIWAFQPFNAFMLALAVGPIWLLARRMGLGGAWAVVATLTASLPALVYAYELIASVKEITALPFVLTIGALVAASERWLRGPPRGALAFALVCAGGLSVLGIGFAAWIGATAVVLAGIVSSGLALGLQRGARTLLLAFTGALVIAVAALPTLLHLSDSLQAAQALSTSANSGNLQAPLKVAQAAGTWLTGLYTSSPSGTASDLTYAAIAVTLAAAVIGAGHLLRRGEHPLVWWLIAMVALGVSLNALATTWIDAKTLMLSSPIVMLLAWAGVAALTGHVLLRALAFALAAVLAAGALVSDALQYNATDLAPTARYSELATIETRFAGDGPTLFTDFDEYSLYVLRDLDVGGPDFQFPPPALSHLVDHHHGYPVDLDDVPQRKLAAYPLIVTRVDPAASRPPSAYRLLWQGTYYEVWGRRPHSAAALVHLGLHGRGRAACRRIEHAANIAARGGAQLVASPASLTVGVPLTGPGYVMGGLDLSPSARLSFAVPHSGRWELWLRGEVMPEILVRIDGRPVASLAGQLAGNEYNPDTLLPISVALSRGRHTLSFSADGSILAPGNGGTASVSRIFLTPPGAGAPQRLLTRAASDWGSLCGTRLDWIEAVRD
jgi:hypothetical protein